jgi:3-oxoacyl-[acyl-carrier protein] reductase
MDLKDRCAIVTGGGRGIGRAICLRLAGLGASIGVVDVREEDAAAVAKEVVALGAGSCAAVCDVRNAGAVERMFGDVVAALGGVHILVNNAGITKDTLIMMMSEEDWDAVLDTNLKSTFNCSKAAVKHMMRKRYGRIINMASVAGQMGNAGQTNYSASKAGQIGFTKALAREVASRNITVNAIAPGFVDTEILNSVPAEMLEAAMKFVPLGRKGQPEEIAYAVAFLASDQAAYITGQVLGVDGGMAMM